jgi:hypothetical protein
MAPKNEANRREVAYNSTSLHPSSAIASARGRTSFASSPTSRLSSSGARSVSHSGSRDPDPGPPRYTCGEYYLGETCAACSKGYVSAKGFEKHFMEKHLNPKKITLDEFVHNRGRCCKSAATTEQDFLDHVTENHARWFYPSALALAHSHRRPPITVPTGITTIAPLELQHEYHGIGTDPAELSRTTVPDAALGATVFRVNTTPLDTYNTYPMPIPIRSSHAAPHQQLNAVPRQHHIQPPSSPHTEPRWTTSTYGPPFS